MQKLRRMSVGGYKEKVESSRVYFEINSVAE